MRYAARLLAVAARITRSRPLLAARLLVQPDLLFVAEERRHIVEDRVYGAPDLVIEVLSPRTRIGRLDQNFGWSSKYGVRECWLADGVSRQMAVLSLGAGGVTGQAVSATPNRCAVRSWAIWR